MLSVGQLLDGRYEILAPLAEGGMGAVYLARRVLLGDDVAIKVILADQEGPAPLERFVRESRACAQLRHPNIVSIFDYGHVGDHQFLVFEYVEGQTLRQMLGSQGSLSIVDVCRLAVPIVDAIAYAHAEGVVHLDLSPRNILIDRSRNPRIMDFGLSQFSKSYQQPGDEIKGTPLYMSPEYFKDGDQVPGRLCPIHQGTIKQRVRRAMEGFFSGLGKKIGRIFR